MRPTYAEISLKSLQNNLQAIRNKVGKNVKIMAIVKANAYGHGLVETSRALVKFGVDYLGVGFLEEAIILRQNNVDAPILVLGGVLGDQIQHFLNNNLEITVSSLELAERINQEAQQSNFKKARVHLKIDTGMGRLGVHFENALGFIEKVAKLPNIEIVGVYSHFATADEREKSFAYYQLEVFNDVLKNINSAGIEIPLKHIANSGAILDIPEAYFNMVRPGILLYGIYPTTETSTSIDVVPSLSLKSKVVFIKTVSANTSISYGRKYFTSSKTKIATIPIGYGDGYSRKLSNKAHVSIKENFFPVVGAVCMDQIMVDLGYEADIHVGDEVVLIGGEITIAELAAKCETNVYEILCGIAARVPRIYI